MNNEPTTRYIKRADLVHWLEGFGFSPTHIRELLEERTGEAHEIGPVHRISDHRIRRHYFGRNRYALYEWRSVADELKL